MNTARKRRHSRHPLQFLEREVHVLQWQYRGGEQPAAARPCRNRRSSRCRREPAHRPRPGRAPERTLRRTRSGISSVWSTPIASISARRACGSQAPSFIGCLVCGSKLPIASQVHAGPPQRMSRQVGVCRVAEDLAVDLQIRAGPALLPPQCVLAERAVLRLEVFLPQLGRLDDVAESPSNTAKSFVIIRSLAYADASAAAACG